MEERSFQQDEDQEGGSGQQQQPWTIGGPARGRGLPFPTAVHPITSGSLELNHWLCLDLLLHLHLLLSLLNVWF